MRSRIITIFSLSVVLLLSFWLTPIKAQSVVGDPGGILVPIGADYQNILPELFANLFDNLNTNNIKVLAFSIDLRVDDRLISDACKNVAQEITSCDIELFEINSLSDIEAGNFELFTSNQRNNIFPDVILLFGEDQQKFVELIQGTSLEELLKTAYNNRVIIVGFGPVINAFGHSVLLGTKDDFDYALKFGAVRLMNSDYRHGLDLGGIPVIYDYNPIKDNNISRLINTIALPETSNVGIGVDSGSGYFLVNESRLQNVFGHYPVMVFDGETYKTSDAVGYISENNFISLRNMVVHLIATGDYYYDIATKQHSLAKTIDLIDRNDSDLFLPPGAGALMLLGGTENPENELAVLTDFINLCGGKNANILVVASGYATDREATRASERFSSNLGIESQHLILSRYLSMPLEIPPDITGIVLIGQDQSLIQTNNLAEIKSLWLSGIPVLVSDAAATIVGQFYTGHPPIADAYNEEAATLAVFKSGRTEILPGLGLLNVNIESKIIQDNRWGRLFSLAYNYPEQLSLGIDNNSGILFTEKATSVIGGGVVVALDMRHAVLDIGENDDYVIANGLMDIFAPGELLLLESADKKELPIHNATPILPTATFTITPSPSPTPLPTSTPTTLPPTKIPKTKAPTRTPRATALPPEIPPPTDPNLIIAMIVVGLFSVVVVIIGVWINRHNIQ